MTTHVDPLLDSTPSFCTLRIGLRIYSDVDVVPGDFVMFRSFNDNFRLALHKDVTRDARCRYMGHVGLAPTGTVPTLLVHVSAARLVLLQGPVLIDLEPDDVTLMYDVMMVRAS
jgi:hypothetical protein